MLFWILGILSVYFPNYQQISNGERVEPSKLHTVTKIMTLLKNVKTYEDKVLNDKYSSEKPNNREISPETIREIEEKILGITYEE